MALLTVASSSRGLVTFVAQAIGAASGRAFASEAAKQPPSAPKRHTSIVEPSYTYMPPGSSMREPLYFSTSDPVYFVDPVPDPQALEQAQAKAPAGEEKAKAKSPSEPVSVKKFDFSSISGKNADDGRPVSYKMADDFSQQAYVVNPSTHSMREPKSVSVSDPKYPPASGKPK
ncbi:hypothetical protein Agub_g6952 [Astrephomene gubernaculifera]|uniref:Uncharacterized protein n=1 Tax=Astrephomene gubernaculifera TaxID=47775 RepID=A0AAD3HLX9_9CHLO|nr:hypothetical protein Agub_g6952 [Astrephomene gubernaculifera]